MSAGLHPQLTVRYRNLHEKFSLQKMASHPCFRSFPVLCVLAAVWGRYGRVPGCRDPPVPSGRRERPVKVSSASSSRLPGGASPATTVSGAKKRNSATSVTTCTERLEVCAHAAWLSRCLPGHDCGLASWARTLELARTWTLLLSNQPVCHRF